MRAAVARAYGPPQVVRVIDVPDPVPADGELLVRVHATTVNRTDCAYRAGSPWVARAVYGLRAPKATVLGCEFAGRVEATGPAVTRFSVGDRVFGYCEGPFGAHAELMTVAQDGWVATVPDGMSFEQVAPATEGSHYALAFLQRVGIRSGQDVLVNGATGGIGSAAVQLLAAIGANVTAVCGAEHVDLLRGLGADEVVDRSAVDFTRGERQYDVVLDAVGKSSFGRCRRLLRPGGVYSSSELGPFAQNLPLAVVTPALRGRKVVFPLPVSDPATVEHLRDLMVAGSFTPLVDRTFGLDEIVEAYRYVETGQKIGNVVVRVAGGE